MIKCETIKRFFNLGDDIKTPKLSRNGSSSRRSDVAEDMSETSTNNEDDNIFEELFNAVIINRFFLYWNVWL